MTTIIKKWSPIRRSPAQSSLMQPNLIRLVKEIYFLTEYFGAQEVDIYFFE